jgi:spore coat protein JB
MMMQKHDDRRNGGCGGLCGGAQNNRAAERSCDRGCGRNDRDDHTPEREGCSCPICALARCGGGESRGDRRVRTWMRRLQMVDFALQELVLYLDMYPDCRRALQKYHALKEEREKLIKALQSSGVPICANGVESHEYWSWIDAPWPWEYDFIGNDKD